jgi:hypothetical protein
MWYFRPHITQELFGEIPKIREEIAFFQLFPILRDGALTILAPGR